MLATLWDEVFQMVKPNETEDTIKFKICHKAKGAVPLNTEGFIQHQACIIVLVDVIYINLIF